MIGCVGDREVEGWVELEPDTNAGSVEYNERWEVPVTVGAWICEDENAVGEADDGIVQGSFFQFVPLPFPITPNAPSLIASLDLPLLPARAVC